MAGGGVAAPGRGAREVRLFLVGLSLRARLFNLLAQIVKLRGEPTRDLLG